MVDMNFQVAVREHDLYCLSCRLWDTVDEGALRDHIVEFYYHSGSAFRDGSQ